MCMGSRLLMIVAHTQSAWQADQLNWTQLALLKLASRLIQSQLYHSALYHEFTLFWRKLNSRALQPATEHMSQAP